MKPIMSDMPNWNDAAVDYALLEKVNPVFNTAKMTLFQLAASGDANAATLARSMGLTLEETQNSATTKASPEQVLGGTIMLEIRYRTMARLAEESGYALVDLPCGYTPRAIEFAEKGLPYYGLDLPAVIQEGAEKITALIPPERRALAHFRAVDATNYASLEKALEDIDGPVCVNTEGLLIVLYRFGSRGAVRQHPPHSGEEGRLLVHGGRGMLPSIHHRHAAACGRAFHGDHEERLPAGQRQV